MVSSWDRQTGETRLPFTIKDRHGPSGRGGDSIRHGPGKVS